MTTPAPGMSTVSSQRPPAAATPAAPEPVRAASPLRRPAAPRGLPPSTWGALGVLAAAFRNTRTRFCVVSFTSDWLFPTAESRAIVHALNAGSARVSFAEIETDKGHDAFLLDLPELFDILRSFLDSGGAARGLKKV